MALWRLWYADGSTVSSDECEPQDVLGYALEVVAQPDPTPGTGNVGYQTITGNFVYFRTDCDLWIAAELESDVMELILAREPIVGVCRGRRLPDARFRAILAEAQEWAEAQGLPTKSGFRPGERV